MPTDIDYLAQSENYRPDVIKTLLIGEAPPPSRKSYFYLPARIKRNVPIERNTSLPATIFYHYFKKLPKDEKEYHQLLINLQELGVFLVDIVDEPIKVRNSPEGLRRVITEIPNLRSKLMQRDIIVSESEITFLLARRNYQKCIRAEFPKATLIRWKDFRLG